MSQLLKDPGGKQDTQDKPAAIVCDGNLQRDYNMVHQVVATAIVSWLALLDGFASAYSSPAESSMVQELNITKSETTWICSLLPVGAFLGSLTGGSFGELLGRKRTFILVDVIFLAGWSINYLSPNCWSMYVSRIMNGYSVGVTSFTLPVYLAETLQPTIRGRLALFPTAFGNFGILICFIAGNIFEWRELAGIGAILTLPFLAAVWIVPESPRWYVSKNEMQKAEKALQWLQTSHCDLSQIQQPKNKQKFLKSHLKTYGIVLGLMFFQQFSGITAIIFYSTQIFKESASALDPSICTAIIGVVNFVATFIAAFVVDRSGRKLLMYFSCGLMGVMLAILGVYFFFLKVKNYVTKALEWLPLGCFVLYVLGFSFGMGPIPWVVMAEVLPAAVRGQAASLSVAFNWGCSFIITKTFPLLCDFVGAHYVFWFFAVVMVCSLVFLKIFVPETKKRTLEDIERILAVN